MKEKEKQCRLLTLLYKTKRVQLLQLIKSYDAKKEIVRSYFLHHKHMFYYVNDLTTTKNKLVDEKIRMVNQIEFISIIRFDLLLSRINQEDT